MLCQEEEKEKEERQTWVDETKLAGAERTWQQSCETMRAAATSLLKDGQATLALFQALIEKDDCKAEMSILSKRQEWLAATLEEDLGP